MMKNSTAAATTTPFPDNGTSSSTSGTKRKQPPATGIEQAWKKRTYDLDPDLPFNDNWLIAGEFKDWAFLEGGCIHCSICHDARVKSKFTSGKPRNDPWKRDQLTQHANGDKHKQAHQQIAEDVAAANALRSSRIKQLDSMRAGLKIVMRCVYWLCCENIAMLKLRSLVNLMRSMPESPQSHMSDNYLNAGKCREFVMSLSAVVKGKVWKDILASDYVSVLIDESTDISTSENMILYIIYIDKKNKRAKTTFVGLEHCPLTDAASIYTVVVEYLCVYGLNMSN